MARTRYATDRGLIARMGATMFLIGLVFTAFIIVIVWLLTQYSNVSSGGIIFIAILVGVGVSFGSYYWSDKIALSTAGARLVEPQDGPMAAELHGVIDRLCALADMPKPRVAIAPGDMPNAFATGRSSKVVVVMTIASFLGIMAALLVRFAFYSELFGGGGRGRGRGGNDQNALPVVLVVLLVGVVVYAISFLLIRLLSRYRELSADRSGALLTGQPSALASALVKVSSDIARIPTRDLRAAEPLNAFYFAPALSATGGRSLSTIFSTHPSLDKR